MSSETLVLVLVVALVVVVVFTAVDFSIKLDSKDMGQGLDEARHKAADGAGWIQEKLEPDNISVNVSEAS